MYRKSSSLFSERMFSLKKSVLLIIAILLLLTTVLAVLHLTTHTPESEGAISINGEAVRISDLELTRVSGTIVNGKGEEKQIDAQGIMLSEVCGEFSSVTVTASDEYSAVVEKRDQKNAYLILRDDGSLMLVVFGDENAKRDVKNVARIDCK